MAHRKWTRILVAALLAAPAVPVAGQTRGVDLQRALDRPVNLQIDDAQDDVTNLSLKLTISQVVAQNILAALFLPALLLLKSGLVGVSLRETSSGD